ncbi:ribosomal RNA-processing protein 7 homolog A [Anopheles aquasalis]|uniref:ribosomal RNA-processing protein 7 homolog A n=1 Tax=Anopheles aquasalis TaxID=42839 RepID=UPI00215A5E8C|nr:ribosomal RNA-processing protein 7 homolog A [Anopheles aquasalis]
MADEFTVLPLKFEEGDTHYHQLFVKKNNIKASSTKKPAGRTIYAVNVPPYVTAASLREAFSAAGTVERVSLQEKPSSKGTTPDQKTANKDHFQFKVAYVVFRDENDIRKLLKKRLINPLNADQQLLTGIDKWTKAYQERIPDPVAMQSEIDQYMATYDKAVEMKKLEESRQTQNDGWTTVTKKNSGVFSQKQSVVKKLEKKLDSDRSTKELRNFYTFQIRESKKNEIISLRKKYDRDVKKMEQMKKTKRFKPY